LEELDAFGCGTDADDADAAGAGPLQQVERRYSAPSRGKHWIDHDDRTPFDGGREFGVVVGGDSRHLIALQTYMPDAGVRDEFKGRIEHTETGAQHRHDDEVPLEAQSGIRPKRRFY